VGIQHENRQGDRERRGELLTGEDRQTLEAWTRAGSAEQRFAQRAQIILAAAGGESTTGLARRLGVTSNTVSKWRTRFAQEGLVSRLRNSFT
jgi:CRP-like cAMP-binding protein